VLKRVERLPSIALPGWSPLPLTDAVAVQPLGVRGAVGTVPE
jgi:hypothetical protein